MGSYPYESPRRALSLVTGPVAEPVTLATAKIHLRLDIDDDDDYIRTVLIPAARSWVEKYCRRALYKQTWRLTLDRFPNVKDSDLVIPPFLSVSGITYLDAANVEQTLDPTQYTVDMADEDVRIYIPSTYASALYNGGLSTTVWGWVKITYVSGYTDGIVLGQNGGNPLEGDPLNKIPAELKLGILLLVDHFYENRELVNMTLSGDLLPFGLTDILGPYRSLRF